MPEKALIPTVTVQNANKTATPLKVTLVSVRKNIHWDLKYILFYVPCSDQGLTGKCDYKFKWVFLLFRLQMSVCN